MRTMRPRLLTKMVTVDDPHDHQLLENCRPSGWVNPTPAKKYNLVVIGGGTAGLVSAAGAAGLGAKVALIERNLIGRRLFECRLRAVEGMSLAPRARRMKRGTAPRFGVTLPGEAAINFSTAMARMRRLRAGISEHDSVERFAQLGVDVFIGNGRFVGPKRD